jgi:hypothetical protein
MEPKTTSATSSPKWLARLFRQGQNTKAGGTEEETDAYGISREQEKQARESAHLTRPTQHTGRGHAEDTRSGHLTWPTQQAGRGRVRDTLSGHLSWATQDTGRGRAGDTQEHLAAHMVRDTQGPEMDRAMEAIEWTDLQPTHRVADSIELRRGSLHGGDGRDGHSARLTSPTHEVTNQFRGMSLDGGGHQNGVLCNALAEHTGTTTSGGLDRSHQISELAHISSNLLEDQIGELNLSQVKEGLLTKSLTEWHGLSPEILGDIEIGRAHV